MAALSKMANGSFAFIWIGKSTENILKFSYMDNAWKIIAAQSICRTFNNRLSCGSWSKYWNFFRVRFFQLQGLYSAQQAKCMAKCKSETYMFFYIFHTISHDAITVVYS